MYIQYRTNKKRSSTVNVHDSQLRGSLFTIKIYRSHMNNQAKNRLARAYEHVITFDRTSQILVHVAIKHRDYRD